MNNKIARIVVDRILKLMEQGEIPWRKRWNSLQPINGITGYEYRGINLLLLSASHYTNPRWFTMKQINELGGYVRKGEQSTPIVYWNIITKEKTNDAGEVEKIAIPILRYYRVFNAEQTEKLPSKYYEIPIRNNNFRPIDKAEEIINNMQNKPSIEHNLSRAYYDPIGDKISLPKPELFESNEAYYLVLFHELAHSTGHHSRLNRYLSDGKMSKAYGKEELIAEISAAMLGNICNFPDDAWEKPTAAYCQGWIKIIKESPSILIQAGSQAQKAVNYILNIRESDNE